MEVDSHAEIKNVKVVEVVIMEPQKPQVFLPISFLQWEAVEHLQDVRRESNWFFAESEKDS